MYWVTMHWVFLDIILGLICSIIFISNMSSELRTSSSGLSWLAVIFFVPVIGICLYLIFGGRKLQGIIAIKSYLYSREKVATRQNPSVIETILAFHHIPATTESNQVSIITDGVLAYESLMQLIKQAKNSIEVQTYIIGNDAVGDAILAALVKKAKEGVKVRLLIDGLFAFVYPRGKLRKLRRAGVDVYLFLPLRFRLFRSRINLRNHRKLLIVDRRFAMMGGMNLAENYMGPIKDEHRWRDLALRLEGESVRQLVKSFCSDWAFASREVIESDCYETGSVSSVSAIQVVPSGPDVYGYPFYNTLLTLIYNAKQSIDVVTPYFVPDVSLYRALSLAAFRGVKVTVVVPRHSNHPVVDLARAGHIRSLIAMGVRILFFEPTMLHAKAMVVDKELAIVGSANFDMRSLFLNFESCLYLYSEKEITEVKAWVESLKKICSDQRDDAEPGKMRVLLENTVSLISPLL